MTFHFRSCLFLILVLVIVNDARAQNKLPDWVQETASAPWQVRDSQGEVVYKNQLWIFGGWFNSYEAPPRDVWSSRDGKDWKLVTTSAPWIHSDLPMSFTFKNKMWMMGGWYNGRLEGHSASNQVWSSKDGANWKLETSAASWTPRIAGAVVEFKGKIWLLGGTENYYFGDSTSLKNDVWYSSDGVEWKLATTNAGWPPRAYHQAAVLNGKMYVFGGGNYVPDYHAKNDVWSSEDGIHWTKITDAPHGMSACGFHPWSIATASGYSVDGRTTRTRIGMTSGTHAMASTGTRTRAMSYGKNVTNTPHSSFRTRYGWPVAWYHPS